MLEGAADMLAQHQEGFNHGCRSCLASDCKSATSPLPCALSSEQLTELAGSSFLSWLGWASSMLASQVSGWHHAPAGNKQPRIWSQHVWRLPLVEVRFAPARKPRVVHSIGQVNVLLPEQRASSADVMLQSDVGMQGVCGQHVQCCTWQTIS